MIYFDIFNSFIDVMFVVDIIVNFRTTYFNMKTGEEVYTSTLIAVNYLKTRFTIDLLATIPFDTIGEIFLGNSNSTMLQIFGLLKLV